MFMAPGLFFIIAYRWSSGKVKNAYCFRSTSLCPNFQLSNLIQFLLLQFSSHLLFPVIYIFIWIWWCFVSSTNFIRLLLLLVPSSIMKMLNNFGLATDPWGAPVINSFQPNLPFLTHATCVSFHPHSFLHYFYCYAGPQTQLLLLLSLFIRTRWNSSKTKENSQMKLIQWLGWKWKEILCSRLICQRLECDLPHHSE